MAVAVVLLLVLLSKLTLPSFGREGNGLREFYHLPQDSVQVVSIGASTTLRGVSPDRLYEKHGISAYNCCTSNQPMIASLALLKSLKQSQKNASLVVLDATCLVKDMGDYDKPYYAERVAESMPLLSLERLEFVSNLAREYEGYGLIEHLIPVFAYHDRWKELNDADFKKSLGVNDWSYSRGQLIDGVSFRSNDSLGRGGKYDASINDAISEGRDLNDADLEAMWNQFNERYFREIVDYCADSNINLLLVKTPKYSWNDKQHDSVALLAEQCGVPFLDMSLSSIREGECDLSYDVDYADDAHVNLLGSLKVSDYLGRYLKEHYDLADVRGSSQSSLFDADCGRYQDDVDDARLLSCDSIEEYLGHLNKERYTVFVAVNGEAAEGLSEEARAKAAELGLGDLSQLASNESYAGVLQGGRRLKEVVSEKGVEVTLSGVYEDGEAFFEPRTMQDDASLGAKFVISSCGANSGGHATIKIGSKDKSENKRGINFVVYDNELGLMVDNSSFDTHVGSARTSDSGRG